MWLACWEGHLPVCKWLFEVGAVADITKANRFGSTPMFMACQEGHLSVCRWLLEVGAGADIVKVNQVDISKGTPMWIASTNHQLPVCRFLILNGALNEPINGSEGGGVSAVSAAIVKREIHASDPSEENAMRSELLSWAQGVVAVHRAFRFAFLPGTLSTPTQRRGSAHLWMLSSQGAAFARLFKELIASFLGGVERGEQLRNAREFAEVSVSEPYMREMGHSRSQVAGVAGPQKDKRISALRSAECRVQSWSARDDHGS